MGQTSKKNKSFFFVFFFICLILAYFPQLSGEFIGDDIGRIQHLPQASSFEVLYHNLGDRPLLIASIWMDKFVFGLDVMGMRIINLLLLAFLCLMARSLINEIGRYFNVEVNPYLRDGLLLLFALHPLNTQAVGHIVQRGILFSCLFGVITTRMLIYCRGNPRDLAWKLGLLFWILALMAKPNIAFLPIWWMMLFYLGGDKKAIGPLGVYLLMLFIPAINYVWGEFNLQNDGQTLTSWEYFLNQGQAIMHYFRLMLWPAPLKFIHHIGNSSAGEIWPGFFLWVLYLSLLAFLWRKSKNRPMNLFVTAGAMAFLPESSFFPIIHTFFEHRAFTPMLFILSGLSFAPFRVDKKLLITVTAVLALIFGVASYKRGETVRLYSSWILDELSPDTCSAPYFVVYSIHQLIAKGELDIAQKALEKVKGCPGDSLSGPVLKAELRIMASKGVDQEAISDLTKILHSDNQAICHVRNFVNKLVVDKISKLPDMDSSCILEDMLSHQVRYLSKNAQGCHLSLQYYYDANQKCLQKLEADPTTARSYQALKIRTIKFSYFKSEDKKLLEDLVAAGDIEDVAYLKEIYNQSLKDRELLKKFREQVSETQ